MKPDLYTKVVLTVIAVSLIVLVVRSNSAIPEARAADRIVDINIAEIAGKKIKTKLVGAAEGALPVINGVDILGDDVPLVVGPRR